MPGQPGSPPSTSRLPLYATTFLVGVVMISLGPVLDPILADLHIPLAQGGLISVAFALGMLIGLVLLNFFFARVPVKWGLIGAASLQTLALGASALVSRNLWSLFLAYLFVGMGCVWLNSLPGMWVSSHVKVRTGHAMIVLLLWFAIGMMVAPIVIGAALGWGATWRWVFGLEAILSLVLMLVLAVSPISNIAGRENLRLRQMRDVVGHNRALFFGVVIAGFLYVGAEFILNVWLAKFTIDTFETSKTVASYVVALFWAGLVIGRLIELPFTKRVPTSRLLLLDTGIMALFALGIALSTSLPMVMVMAFVCGLGTSASYPLIISFSGRFHGWHSGVVYCAMVMGSGFGRIIFPYVVGPIANSLGFRIAIGLAFLLAAVVAGMSFFLRRASGEAATPDI
jgi:fucose permease